MTNHSLFRYIFHGPLIWYFANFLVCPLKFCTIIFHFTNCCLGVDWFLTCNGQSVLRLGSSVMVDTQKRICFHVNNALRFGSFSKCHGPACLHRFQYKWSPRVSQPTPRTSDVLIWTSRIRIHPFSLESQSTPFSLNLNPNPTSLDLYSSRFVIGFESGLEFITFFPNTNPDSCF